MQKEIENHQYNLLEVQSLQIDQSNISFILNYGDIININIKNDKEALSLIKILSAYKSSKKGVIKYLGKEVQKKNLHYIGLREDVEVISNNISLFPTLSILENFIIFMNKGHKINQQNQYENHVRNIIKHTLPVLENILDIQVFKLPPEILSIANFGKIIFTTAEIIILDHTIDKISEIAEINQLIEQKKKSVVQ